VSELAYVKTHFDLPSSAHFVADFFKRSANLHRKRPFCSVELPFRGLEQRTMFIILGSLESP